MTKLGGIDLSLTGTGAVALKPDWDLQWRSVARASFGVSLRKTASAREVTHRLIDIKRDVVRWLIREGVTHVYVEQAVPGVFNAVQLGELRGAFRIELLEQAGLDPIFVPEMTSRCYLLGKVPQKNRKAAVVEALRAAGADFEDGDQFDAFTAVNLHLDDHGAPSLKNLLWDPAAEPKRVRRGTVRRKGVAA